MARIARLYGANPNRPKIARTGAELRRGSSEHSAAAAAAAATATGAVAATAAARHVVRTQALTPATSCFAHLLSALHRRLHVVPAALELPQDALRCHLALEVLDGALDALVADLDFERLTLNGITGVCHEAGFLTRRPRVGNALVGVSVGQWALWTHSDRST